MKQWNTRIFSDSVGTVEPKQLIAERAVVLALAAATTARSGPGQLVGSKSSPTRPTVVGAGSGEPERELSHASPRCQTRLCQLASVVRELRGNEYHGFEYGGSLERVNTKHATVKSVVDETGYSKKNFMYGSTYYPTFLRVMYGSPIVRDAVATMRREHRPMVVLGSSIGWIPFYGKVFYCTSIPKLLKSYTCAVMHAPFLRPLTPLSPPPSPSAPAEPLQRR